jgi:phage-related protein
VRTALQDLWNTIITNWQPLLADLRYWFGIIGAQIRQIGDILSTVLGVSVSGLVGIVSRARDFIAGAFTFIRDVISGVMITVNALLSGFIGLLSGDMPRASAAFQNALVNALTVIAYIFKNTIAKAAVWGWNLIVQFANGITKAATGVLASVMRSIGNFIGRFIRPGSAPKEGPLSGIIRWGKGIMDTYLRSFALADFGVLRDVMAPIEQALQTAVSLGDIKEKNIIPLTQKIRQEVAGLMSDFRKTGVVNEKTLAVIRGIIKFIPVDVRRPAVVELPGLAWRPIRLGHQQIAGRHCRC